MEVKLRFHRNEHFFWFDRKHRMECCVFKRKKIDFSISNFF